MFWILYSYSLSAQVKQVKCDWNDFEEIWCIFNPVMNKVRTQNHVEYFQQMNGDENSATSCLRTKIMEL